VERHPTRERAGDDEPAQRPAEERAREVVGGAEIEVGGVVLSDVGRRGDRVVSGEARPRRDRVEDSEPDHGDVERARHILLGVPGFLPVVGRHLPADP
jgi:hypothetical protein